MRALRLHVLALAAALVATAACGGSDSGSPVGPSPAESGGPSGPAPSTSGATVSGKVIDSASAQARTMESVHMMGGLTGIKVSVEGTDLSATTGAGGLFELRGVPAGRVRLNFQAPRAAGTLELDGVSQTESIELSVIVSGTSIEVESQERSTGAEAQLEGKVAAADYAARSLLVGTTTVVVPDGTPITNGHRALALTDVIVGARIHVKGARSGDTLTASRVMVQQTGLERLTLSGTASEVAGTCPDRTFRFGSTVIAVNLSTIFVQGSCDAIAGGISLEVKGLRRTDGSVLATMVKFKSGGGDDDDEDEDGGVPVEVSGAISNLRGPCPARKFNVSDREVHTTGATTFLTPCATLADGQQVTVKGEAAGNGMVIASEVK